MQDVVEATTHSVTEGGEGAVPLARLASRPSAILSLHGATQDPQHGDRNRVANPALVLPSAHVQWVMRAVFNAPIQTNQFQQPGRIGLISPQAGKDPNGFDFLFASLEFANAVNACQLKGMRKTHLFRRDFQDLDAAPLDAPVAHIDRHHLRGKNPPAGGAWLAGAGFLGCP